MSSLVDTKDGPIAQVNNHLKLGGSATLCKLVETIEATEAMEATKTTKTAKTSDHGLAKIQRDYLYTTD